MWSAPEVKSVPCIQSITTESNVVQTIIGGVSSVLNIALVPVLSILGAETYLNNVYLPTLHGPDVQMVAHVFSAIPLNIKLMTADAGIVIPANWWQL